MTIDCSENTIQLLPGKDGIPTVVQSQLTFWKFRRDSANVYSYVGPNFTDVLVKLVAYLNKFDFAHKVSRKAKTKLTQSLKNEESFSIAKGRAQAFKHGQIDKLQFTMFNRFIVSHISRKLKPHQLKAAFHLYLLGNGANFSVPGSGKTSVVLTVYEKLRSEGKVNRLFVVGPPSCFAPWKQEFLETLGRNPKSAIIAGTNKLVRNKAYANPDSRIELYLTTFQSLLYDQSEVDLFLSRENNKIFLVIDEAHYIKQINGNWANAILNQARKAVFRCALTGTPMPRSYTDVFNLFDFLWPQQNPISHDKKVKIKIFEKKKRNEDVKEILRIEIGPLFYRVRKSDLRLKEQVFVPPIRIPMNKIERNIYDAIYSKIQSYSKKEYLRNIDTIRTLGKSRIVRLRQAVSYAKLLLSAINDSADNIIDPQDDNLRSSIMNYDKLEMPAKIQYLLKKVGQLQKKKQKVVIWSNFIETIQLIERHLKKNSFKCKKIFGSTPIETASITTAETREKIRDEFVDPDSGLDILIANPAACAESISLHKTCQNAIYYDLSYNCAQYLQSQDRIHRVGGSETKISTYYFLQYSDTIDTDIKRNLDEKSEKMKQILDEDYAIYSLDMAEEDEDIEAYKRLFLKKNG